MQMHKTKSFELSVFLDYLLTFSHSITWLIGSLLYLKTYYVLQTKPKNNSLCGMIVSCVATIIALSRADITTAKQIR
jgi:hypothetical protein